MFRFTIPFPLLDLDVLRTFVAIADTGSFAAAAETVFRTPSAVSMQIKKLEEMLGRAVFIRDSRSVKLTRDGEILLEHGRRLLALNRELVAKFRAPDIAGEVRLGAPDDAAERFLPGMLSRFGESHAGVTVNVIVENTIPLIERVRQKQVDIALITCSPVPPGFRECRGAAARAAGLGGSQGRCRRGKDAAARLRVGRRVHLAQGRP